MVLRRRGRGQKLFGASVGGGASPQIAGKGELARGDQQTRQSHLGGTLAGRGLIVRA